MVKEAFKYDLSEVPEKLRSQCGADIMAAQKYEKDEKAREAYIRGMIHAYSRVQNMPL